MADKKISELTNITGANVVALLMELLLEEPQHHQAHLRTLL